MNFVSLSFPVFLAAVLFGLRLIPSRCRWMLLLPASWFFYAWHSPALLGLLLGATLVSWLCGLGVERTGRKKRFLLLGGWFLLGLLFLFKYLNLAASGICALMRVFGKPMEAPNFSIVLPMGISFYIFQTLSYLIDVSQGTIPAERHFGIYALYISFFPQLVAGPIERPGDLLPQLRCPKEPDETLRCEALRNLVRGYAKKVMIADCIAGIVDHAYSDPAASGGGAMMLATLLFAVQIYCDFSGYSEIAMGCAGLAGIRLSRNFCNPYRAVTLRDFWRRWHISLSRWFTDYVYIPLGGSRKGLLRHCRNLLIVFLLSGLWHGADITFILWGGLHGLFLAAETLIDRGDAPRHPQVRRILTLAAVCFAWIFFRAASWEQAVLILRTLPTGFAAGQILSGLGIGGSRLLMTLGLLLTLPMLERLPAMKKGSNMLLYFLLITAIVFCRFLTFYWGGAPAFLYFQF